MEIFGFGSIFFAHCFCSAGLFFRAVLLFSLAQSFVPASTFCVPCSRRAGLSPPLAFLSLFSFFSFVAGHFWAVLLFSLAQSFVLAYPFCVPCSCRAGLSPPLAFLFLFPFFLIVPCSRRDGHFILASSFLFLYPFSIFRAPLLFGYPIFVLTPLPFFLQSCTSFVRLFGESTQTSGRYHVKCETNKHMPLMGTYAGRG